MKANRTIDLCGRWMLDWSDGQRGRRAAWLAQPDADLSHAIPATVPGEVHDELVKQGTLADLNLGLNHLSARWVEENFWFYRRTFKTPRLRAGERAWLSLDGLDLAAVIFLNGKEVGRHANFFYPCRLEVTEQLLRGENVLLVQVESGLFHAMDRSAEGYGVTIDSRLGKRPWLRKPQSSFGWDWSPRLLNVGIQGRVELEIHRVARWDSSSVVSELSGDLERGTVHAKVFVEGLTAKSCDGTLLVELTGTGIKTSVPVKIQPGMNRLEACMEIANPDLWWPIGHGKQPLYPVSVTLRVGDLEVGACQRKIGFRHVQVNQDPHPVSGQYFILEVNGKRIFVKGGNFVPADMIMSKIDRERYKALVDLAIEANFNLLRVWGGGLYEKDEFYELCDAKGILVWQEFIFACAKYPATDEKFLADFKKEAAYQVRRLAHHASLVVWCGNNELEMGNFSWGYEKGVAYPDYALFHLVIPVILKREDPTRYYQPSSPFSPDHEDPSRDDVGDQHPWSVGMEKTDFRDYRKMICRFPNEGGILGPTSLPTVRACLQPGAEGTGSMEWEAHENNIAYWSSPAYPDVMLEQWLGRSRRSMSIEEYVYWGGVVQGEGLSEYVKNFRRRMFDSAAAIFWMYNDCWPAVRSWTIVDYYLRRTPSFHPVRRAMAPVAVVVTREENKVRVSGVNDGPECEATLRYGLMELAGSYPLDESVEVTLPANSSTMIAEWDARVWDKKGIKTHCAFALLFKDGREIARDRLFQPFFREMRWPKPNISVKMEKGKAIFRSKTFAWRVCLDLDGEKQLSDNFFDIYPGVPTVLDWSSALGKPVICGVGNRC